MTAVYTAYNNGNPVARSAGSNTASFPMRHTIENVFDASQRNLLATNVVNPFINIPGNTLVEWLYYEVLEADTTTTPTISIGDVGSATRYFTTAAVATKGANAVVVGGNTTNNWYKTGGRIILTAGTALVTLKLRVVLAVTSFG
jgi:hypothetical protein